MAKLIIHFEIPYDLKKKSVRNCRLHTEPLGQLRIIGTFDQCHDHLSVNIDFVRLKGTDIRPVLENWQMMDDLEEYCMRQAHKFVPQQKEVAA